VTSRHKTGRTAISPASPRHDPRLVARSRHHQWRRIPPGGFFGITEAIYQEFIDGADAITPGKSRLESW
jgi:hypothetical protein